MDDKYMDLMGAEMAQARRSPGPTSLSLPLARNSSPNSSEDDKAIKATQMVTTMFGCYRKDEANDPKVYLTAAVGILVRYSISVIASVTDPIKGLPSTNKFLPALAEIKEACEKEARKEAESERYRNWGGRMRQEALPRPANQPNLFVPEDFRHYEALMEKHKQSEGKYSRVERRKCEHDGVTRLGVWVPLSWMDDVNQKRNYVENQM